MAVFSTDSPTDPLFEEQLDSAPPFFGFSPAEPNATRRLQAVVRPGVALCDALAQGSRARLKLCRVGTQILPHV